MSKEHGGAAYLLSKAGVTRGFPMELRGQRMCFSFAAAFCSLGGGRGPFKQTFLVVVVRAAKAAKEQIKTGTGGRKLVPAWGA